MKWISASLTLALAISATAAHAADGQFAKLEGTFSKPAPDAIDTDEPAGQQPLRPYGSLRTVETLGAGNVGLSLGGGIAVLLPYYGFEVGVGLHDRVDLVGRFETVIGVFHYPHLGLRFMPLKFGDASIGLSTLLHYSFSGIETDQTNFASTFYASAELGISGPVTDESYLVFGVGGELDFFEYDVVDDEGEVIGGVRYDATVFRGAVKTVINDDLDGYAQLRIRVPTETFVYEAQQLYVIPMLELGGTWTF